jgi:oxidoreductase
MDPDSDICAVYRLGTTRAAAGGIENFVKIDRDYVLATAAAARVAGLKQRLLYCSVCSYSLLYAG